MILNENEKERYYILEKKAIIEEYKNHIIRISDFPIMIHDGNDEAFSVSDYIVYKGVELLSHPFLQEDGTLREATDRELVEKGIYTLAEDQVLVGENAKYIYEFPISDTLVKPVFNKETLEWVESATPEEIAEHEKKTKYEFYNSELNLATKAFTEYDLGLATEEDLQEVKLYMCSISPYQKETMLFRMAKVKRPSIFDRYK